MAGEFRGGSAGGVGGGRFHYIETEERPKISKSVLARIARYFLPYWKLIILLAVAIIITAVLGLLPAIITRNIIDIALPQKNLNLLVILIFSSFGAVLLRGLISVGQNYLNSWISKYIIYDIRNSMFNHLQHMGIRFFSNVKTGEITSLMSNDIGGIESTFSNTFVHITQNVFTFAITAITMFYTNWKLAIAGMLILPLFILPTRKVGKVRWKLATQTQDKLAELNTIIYESLSISGTMLVKLFTREKTQYEKFEKVNKDATQLQIKESLAGRWFFMAISSVVAIGPMIIYLIGGLILIKYDDITIGSIVMFVALLSRLYGPVTSFANISVDLTRSMALFERIFKYMDIKQDIADKTGSLKLSKVKGHIKFENVNFSYNEKALTIRDINIDIKAGQMIAFVGPSGSGKTTLTYMLPRFYDVDSGCITIDGLDIKKIRIESLREQIGMVTQDSYLFNASIKDNLLFSNPNVTEEEIIQACRTANIHDMIISLADGYDTVVGDRGIKLSGGEKQRIAIARVLLKNPRIVILDEATSALDSVSESLIQSAIEPLLAGRTSLVIAHRLSTILASDCIYVLKSGQIVEQGTNEQLLALNGVYKNLYDKQFNSPGKQGDV